MEVTLLPDTKKVWRVVLVGGGRLRRVSLLSPLPLLWPPLPLLPVSACCRRSSLPMRSPLRSGFFSARLFAGSWEGQTALQYARTYRAQEWREVAGALRAHGAAEE